MTTTSMASSSSISPATQRRSTMMLTMSRGLFVKPMKTNQQMGRTVKNRVRIACQASSIPADREKRKLLNLLLVGYQIQASRVLPSILEIEKGRPFMMNVFCRKASWIRCQMRGGASRRMIAFALDTGGDSQGQSETTTSGLGSTRLGRIAVALGKQLLVKINAARRNFPMKIFLLLLGFYTANALATILGQTGDWDVLVAGIVVAAIEGIGMLMYRKKKPSSFVVFMNFWKAGVCLGLFVDAFKLGS